MHTIADALGMLVLPSPRLLVARSWEKFDSSGDLVDVQTRRELASVLAGLTEWTMRLQINEKILA